MVDKYLKTTYDWTDKQFKKLVDELSDRDISILEYVVYGCSAPEISKELGISSRTVEGHILRLCEKFQVSSKTQLAVLITNSGAIKVKTPKL